MIDRTITQLDQWAERTGKAMTYLPLLLVLIQFAVVLIVYVFSKGSIKLQESMQYINALMFLGAAGYTLKRNEHVRVDLFYARFNQRQRAFVNLVGTILLLFPFLGLVWYAAIPYVTQSWAINEGSIELSGLHLVYILKSTLLLFPLTLSLQGLAEIFRSIAIIRRGQ